MKIIINQTVYKCSFCKKKYFTKGRCINHEHFHCKHENSPNMKKIREKQKNCKHDNFTTEYRYMHGEAVKEPDYNLCLDCGAKF